MRLDKLKIEDRMKSVGISTYQELAERMGISREALSNFMSGTYNPSWNSLSAMCNALECRVDDIVVYDSPKVAALAAS
ncbi:MAG: helix-turn-helix transcriptional regulator [Caldilineaceae bacterium]|nr:helix-turn-helix transcriptional regulator [Caldilineaceae bacterium]